jgi:hypothetical protein
MVHVPDASAKADPLPNANKQWRETQRRIANTHITVVTTSIPRKKGE